MRNNTIDNIEETKLLHELIGTASICIISIDKEGTVTSINRAGEKLYGYRSDEIVGKNINILFSDRNPKALIEEMDKKRLKGENWEAEVWRTRKDGLEIITWLSASYLFDEKGYIKGTLGISRDITRDRKDAERLRILKDLINAASICMLTTDADGIVTSINKAGGRLYGYRTDEIVGKSVSRLFSDRNSKALIEEMDKKRLEGESWEAEVWRTRKDGSEILTWLSTSYLFDGDGKVRGTLGISRDITREKEIQSRYKHLWDLVDSASICIMLVDREGKVTSINKAAEYLYGYRADEFLGKNISIIFSDKNPPDLIDWIEKKRLNGEDWEAELWRKRKNGRDVLTWLSTSYLIDESGQMQGALGIARDITKEKKNQQKLRFAAGLLEAIPYCVVSTDPGGNITTVNQAGQKIFGYSCEELIGKHIGLLHASPVSGESIEEIYGPAGTGPVWEGEILGKRKTGDIFPAWLSTSSIFDKDGMMEGVVGVYRDITRLNESRKNLEIMERLVNNAALSIIATDEGGKIVSINKVSEEMYGYQEAELIGRDISLLFSDKNRPVLTERLAEKSRRGESWEAELWRRKKDGEEFPTWISTSYIFDESGNIKGALGIGRDITDRKVFEEKLLHSARLTTLGEIAAGVAHEVRNPLTGLKLGLNSLGEAVAENAQAGEIIGDLVSEMDRLERVVAQLLSFARKREPHREKRDINEILDRTIFYVRKTIEKQGIEVARKYDSNLPLIDVDGDQILQVFLNLILNAVQAMETEGTLELRTNLCTVRAGTGIAKKEIAVEIKDTGNGIPAEDLSRVFSPFFTTREQGTGLGLAMSKRIIEAHKGTIEIKSREGEGTTVSVFLTCG